MVILLKTIIPFPQNPKAVNRSPGKSTAPWDFSPPMTECSVAHYYTGSIEAITATVSSLLQGLHHDQIEAFHDSLSQLTILMKKEGERKGKRREIDIIWVVFEKVPS